MTATISPADLAGATLRARKARTGRVFALALAALLGVAVGVISLAALLAALLLGCVLALLWAAITRTRQLPFGPWLGLGAVIAAGLTGF